MDETFKFIQTIGVPNAMAIYLIWYYGKKFDRVIVLLTALAVRQGIFTEEK